MVFDVVVCSPGEELGDLSPLIAKIPVSFDNDLILLLRPFSSFDIRVQVIMPSFSALLPNAAWEMA